MEVKFTAKIVDTVRFSAKLALEKIGEENIDYEVVVDGETVDSGTIPITGDTTIDIDL